MPVLSADSKPNIVKSKVIQENAGAVSHGKYELGDMVSMDQCTVKTPGWLPIRVMAMKLTITSFIEAHISRCSIKGYSC